MTVKTANYLQPGEQVYVSASVAPSTVAGVIKADKPERTIIVFRDTLGWPHLLEANCMGAYRKVRRKAR